MQQSAVLTRHSPVMGLACDAWDIRFNCLHPGRSVFAQQHTARLVALLLWPELLSLQGHALMTRHAGSANPCPVIDFDAGFNAWMAYAYGLPKGVTVEKKFGKPFGES